MGSEKQIKPFQRFDTIMFKIGVAFTIAFGLLCGVLGSADQSNNPDGGKSFMQGFPTFNQMGVPTQPQGPTSWQPTQQQQTFQQPPLTQPQYYPNPQAPLAPYGYGPYGGGMGMGGGPMQMFFMMQMLRGEMENQMMLLPMMMMMNQRPMMGGGMNLPMVYMMMN